MSEQIDDSYVNGVYVKANGTEQVEITPQYVYMTVPSKYVCVYHKLLVLMAQYGLDMLNDSSFEELGKAIEANDVKAAFESAHTLKGLAANMGLDPMLDIVVELVEPLRNGILDGMDVIYLKLMEEKKEYDKFLDA